MTLLWIVLVIAIIGGTVAVALGRGEALAPVHRDQPGPALPAEDRPLTAEDLAATRFAVGLRGYRMDEVDSLLDRLQRELAARDRRLADLEPARAHGRTAAPTPSTAPPAPEPVGSLEDLGDAGSAGPAGGGDRPADRRGDRIGERPGERPEERDDGR